MQAKLIWNFQALWKNIAKAKGEMAQAIEINGNVILNADDEFVLK